MNKHLLMSLPALVALGLTGCASNNNAQQRLNDQTVTAVNWTQQSGEYQALTWQAFNLATQTYDHAASLTGKPKAVIVDLDETMLDNSAYPPGRPKPVSHSVIKPGQRGLKRVRPAPFLGQ